MSVTGSDCPSAADAPAVFAAKRISDSDTTAIAALFSPAKKFKTGDDDEGKDRKDEIQIPESAGETVAETDEHEDEEDEGDEGEQDEGKEDKCKAERDEDNRDGEEGNGNAGGGQGGEKQEKGKGEKDYVGEESTTSHSNLSVDEILAARDFTYSSSAASGGKQPARAPIKERRGETEKQRKRTNVRRRPMYWRCADGASGGCGKRPSTSSLCNVKKHLLTHRPNKPEARLCLSFEEWLASPVYGLAGRQGRA